MKNLTTLLWALFFLISFLSCEPKHKNADNDGNSDAEKITADKNDYGGFTSQIEYGEHLVTITDCNVCHTPKKMTDHGPVPDTSLLLSGHPAEMPRIEIDREEFESKGLIVARDLTEWVGPWGVSFAANLTPDETGLGNWTEEQFFLALREGKFKGIQESRTLLPPMPWESFSHMTDGEIKAIFAYLKSIKPVSNIVPQAIPPASVIE